MSSIIELLAERFPPPSKVFRLSDEDWRGAERKLGLNFPADYKTIIETYGDFYWADFLHVLNPFSENKYLNFFSRSEMILSADRTTREKFPAHYPINLFPEPNGLLPVFITDNGDTGYWLTNAAPDRWAILIKDARSPEFEVHFINITAFLHRFTNGKFRSIVLPQDI